MNRHSKYFKILGIEPTSDQNIIKKAYRRMAMHYHPDKNPSEDAQSKFIEITEAYELLSGQKKKVSTPTKGKTSEQARQAKIKQAKARYKKMRDSEQEKDARYYKKITSGWRWKVFRGLAIYSFIFAVLLTADYFLTGRQKSVSELQSYSYLPKTMAYEDELFQILEPSYWENDFPPVRLNYGLFFKDLKSVSVIDEPIDVHKTTWPSDHKIRSRLFENYPSKEFYSYGSVYYIFPFYQICLLLPFFLLRYKRPTINFAIGRLICIWIIFPSVIYLSFSSGRIFELFGLL